MPVSTLDFAAQVGAWARETDQRMTAVFRASAQDVISTMQTPVGAGGNMPVDTGFLRSSLQVSLNAEPVPAALPNPNPNVPVAYTDVASLVIAGAEIGDRVVASYSAVYAPVIEYGGGNRQPRRFVALAAAQWQSIVKRNAEALKASVSGSSGSPAPSPQ